VDPTSLFAQVMVNGCFFIIKKKIASNHLNEKKDKN
jgi:hypothetical protein